MTKNARWPLSAALALALTTPAFAQQAVSGQAQGQASSQAQVKPMMNAGTDAQAQTDAAATLEAQQRMDAVKEKGAKVSADSRAKAEAKLEASAKKADSEAQRGEGRVAERLAVEFGMTADALMAEKQELGCTWGELMIAHSLDANTTTEITVAQLVQMRKDGTGWGQIAAGLGLKLGEAVSAAQAESRVAAGLAKPDGKVAVIHGEGARAGVGGQAGADAGVHAAGTQVGANAGAGVGVGVKIKP